MQNEIDQLEGIAVIGIAARFPDAPNVEQFWKNLCVGIESVTEFTDEQLLSAGVEPGLLRSPHFVKTGIVLKGVELFDASFFGFTPREAELTDPQHRLFLECAWEALEDAAYDPDRTNRRIGVFAGAGPNLYFQNNLLSNPDLVASLNQLQRSIAIEGDYLATRVSYKLNLRGPSLTIQTACSTSLVATHIACQSLLNGECDMALAGGAFIKLPQIGGYVHQEGSQQSPDGHCRAFDASARGMVTGSGAGVVVLKRLPDALRDRDCIRAVIRGSAINNDGAEKIGYAAPSEEGQAAAIAEAQAVAGVSADEVTYVETHGTGTVLGDPIEVAGLTKAFRRTSQRRGFCAIGSVKTNIGHLSAAAGIAGLIKVVLALQNRQIPPSLNFKMPNPAIDFADSPFHVQQTLAPWISGDGRRVAGVSSFGIGGTNAHVIVEEAPALEVSEESQSWQVLPISAKSSEALEQTTDRLTEHLATRPKLSLADVAFTLQEGRKPFAHRRIVAARSLDEASRLLISRAHDRVFTGVQEQFDCPVAFMFTGQAAQYLNMGLDLYSTEKRFQKELDFCCEFLQPHIGIDLRHVLYPSAENAQSASEQLHQTAVTQPAMFVVEYALAKTLIGWGVRPDALIGHSIGEYVAACLAGVFSLEDALTLVATRGKLMQSMPKGAMLAVRLEERSLHPYLGNELFLAVINSQSACVIAGSDDAIQKLQATLTEKNILCTLLPTSRAFHSGMMEPVLGPFKSAFRSVKMSPPKIPFLSNVTGDWITPQQATDPGYWSAQLRQTVRFADGVGELLKTSRRILLEVGPGHTLTSLAKQHPQKTPDQLVLSSFGYTRGAISESCEVRTTLGRLWIAGVAIDWDRASSRQNPRRVALPTYPFARQKYWIEPRRSSQAISGDVELSQGVRNGESNFSGGAEEMDRTSVRCSPDEPPQSRDTDVPQMADLEKVVASVWREVLGFEEMGIHDNFFLLGGESLAGIQILSRLRALLDIELPASALFEAPSIAEFAQYMVSHGSVTGFSKTKAEVESRIEVTTEQEVLQASSMTLGVVVGGGA